MPCSTIRRRSSEDLQRCGEHESSARRSRPPPRAASPRPSRSWRRSCAAATGSWSPSRAAARPSAPATTSTASTPASSSGLAPSEPAVLFDEAPLDDGFVSPELRLGVIPFRRLVHRRRAAAPGAGSGTDGELRRPARGRLRRPRRPRDRPLRRLRDQDGRRGHPRLPRARVPGRGQGLRAHRPAREDQPLRRRRRRGAAALGAGLEALGRGQGARAARGARARRRAAQPLRRAPGAPRPRLRARRRVAARARALVPLPRDGRPDRRDRGGQGRHGVRAADGPPDLRRRRLRQDRGRAARRPQGGRRGQAGDDAGADHDPRPAAPRHLPRAARLDRARGRDGLAAAQARRGPRGARAVRRGHGRHPDRHPPAALARRARRRTSGW